MVPPNLDTTLIDRRKKLLEKMEKQSRWWSLFSVVSFTALFLLIVLIGLWSFASHTFILGSISLVCIFWWSWTIIFIKRAVTFQKEIYNLLGDISYDMENIRRELIQIEQMTPLHLPK